MHGPREVLNDLKWHEHALAEAEITFVHRGAPGDVKHVSGADVVDLGRSFFGLRERHGVSSIPYHRVVRIERRGALVWERRKARVEAVREPERDEGEE